MDGAAAALIAIGLLEDEPALAWSGAGVYVLGAPTLHLGHERPSTAQTSLLLRVLAPAIASLVGAGAAHGIASNDGRGLMQYAGPGLLVGGLLAVVVDSLILAHPE
jgi:hypothetical protein